MNENTHDKAERRRAEQFWEAHYRGHERVSSGMTNPVLVDVVRGWPPARRWIWAAAKGAMPSGWPGSLAGNRR